MGKKFSLNTANKQNKMKIACSSFMSALLLLFLLSPSGGGGVLVAMADGGPKTDFNGDGYEDLAAGVPNESINGKANAGSVNVVYGSASGVSATAVPDQRFFQDLAGIDGVSKLDDRLGTDVAAADFNGDGYSDLAAGAPGDDYGSPSTGSVNVIYGSSGGLSATAVRADQIWTGSSPGLNDIVLADCSPPAIPDLPIQGFGTALAAGDFNGDGYDDLAIVADDNICFTGQGSSAGTFWVQGSLHIIYGSSSGLAITPSLDNQHTIGHQISFYTTLEAGDFNNDGKDDLAAGDPGDFCCSGAAGSQGGRIAIFHGEAGGFAEVSGMMAVSQNFRQGSANIEGASFSGEAFGSALASGKFNGDSYDDLAAGDPNEGLSDGGAVNIIYGSASGLSATFIPDQLFTQDSPNVEGTIETEDRFGSALAAGDLNGDGKDDLVVGSPDEDVGPTVNAGSSNVIYGSAAGLSPTAVLPDRVLDQNSANVEGTSEATDAYSSPGTGSGGFAAAITTGDYNNDGRDDLAIGVPGEDVGAVVDAGSSNVIYGSTSGISATAVLPDRVLDQNSAEVEDSSETGDRFGNALT